MIIGFRRANISLLRDDVLIVIVIVFTRGHTLRLFGQSFIKNRFGILMLLLTHFAHMVSLVVIYDGTLCVALVSQLFGRGASYHMPGFFAVCRLLMLRVYGLMLLWL